MLLLDCPGFFQYGLLASFLTSATGGWTKNCEDYIEVLAPAICDTRPRRIPNIVQTKMIWDGWFIRENPTKMNDLGVHHFRKPPYCNFSGRLDMWKKRLRTRRVFHWLCILLFKDTFWRMYWRKTWAMEKYDSSKHSMMHYCLLFFGLEWCQSQTHKLHVFCPKDYCAISGRLLLQPIPYSIIVARNKAPLYPIYGGSQDRKFFFLMKSKL